MTERRTPTPDRPEAGRYEIRLTGHLDAHWAAWFDGLTVSQRERRDDRHQRPDRRPGGAPRPAPASPRPRPAAGLGHPRRAKSNARHRHRSRIDPDQQGERHHDPTRIRSIAICVIATMALATVAFGLVDGSGRTAAGLRNCVDITGPQSGRVGCYEDRLGGRHPGPDDVLEHPVHGRDPEGARSVLRAGTTDRQAAGRAAQHVPARPRRPRGPAARTTASTATKLQGFFVLCSGQGIVSGACIPSWTSVGSPTRCRSRRPSMDSRSRRPSAIESAATAGNLALINLGPGAVIVGAITGND